MSTFAFNLHRQPAPSAALFQHAEDREFLEMRGCYAEHGGLTNGDDIARDIGRHVQQPISVVAHWIVERRIVSIAWRSRILIPRFQFTADGGEVRAVVRGSIAQLGSVFNDWEIARWFAEPNSWLHDMKPLELVGIDDQAVIDSARADYFVLKG